MEMPVGEYEISYFEKGDYQDQNGNYWCNILFKGYSSEPIRIVVKDPMAYSVGQKLYGHLEIKTSQAGKPYNRFYRDKKPDYQSGEQQGARWVQDGSKMGHTTDDATRESINRSVALKAAVDYLAPLGKDMPNGEGALKLADRFLAWLNNEKPKLDTSTNPLDSVFRGSEQYEGNPDEIPFD